MPDAILEYDQRFLRAKGAYHRLRHPGGQLVVTTRPSSTGWSLGLTVGAMVGVVLVACLAVFLVPGEFGEKRSSIERHLTLGPRLNLALSIEQPWKGETTGFGAVTRPVGLRKSLTLSFKTPKRPTRPS